MVSLPMTRRGGKPNLFGLDRKELAEYLSQFDVPAFHADQAYRWLYARRRFDIAGWTDLPTSLRAAIADGAAADPGVVAERGTSPDGTVKLRIDLAQGGQVEAVRMVQSERVTYCLSSQVGCALDCDFCLTGKMGFKRQLTPGEIVGQVVLVSDAGEQEGQRPSNLVFMGMGEPLHNYDAVLAAIRLLTDVAGFGLSRRRITVSTVGLVPAIERLTAESVRPRLAVSLNATTDELRDRLMPINRKYPIDRLLDACRGFAEASGERVTFEYVLLGGVNDSSADVERLAKLVRRMPAKLNLIPFNPVPGWLDYRPPERRRILDTRDRLLELSVPVSIRWSRGADARAACGQLALLPDKPGGDT